MSLGITLVPLPTRYVALAAGDLACHDVPPQPGMPVAGTAVFVPGYTGSKEDFGLLAAPVTEAGYRYVAFDQRGQFESKGPDDPAAYTIDALAAELVELLGVLGDGPAHVVGHSFGGLVARAAAVAAPEAFASLVLLGSGPAGITGPRVERMRALAPLLDEFGPEVLFEAIASALPPAPGDDPLRAFLRHRFLESNFVGMRQMGEDVTGDRDRCAELRASGVRVAVVTGERDDAWEPEIQREMAERLGAPFHVVPGAIHSPAAERPAETARVLLDVWRS